MVMLYFHIFERGFEVLNATFQAPVYVTIVTPLSIAICNIVGNDISLVV